MKDIINNNKKFLVGVSGGVDSSVTVALLQKKGFEVEGIFLDFWRNEKSEAGFESAKKVAESLNIALFKVDARKEFKKEIVKKFIEEYERGNTPNPCVICNPQMKFKTLLGEAKKRKADFVATGHYAKLERRAGKKERIVSLFPAKDKIKDQSYFLHRLSQKQLNKIMFPLGDYLKSEVRELAEKFGLSTAKREESQDVCFISQNNFSDFLKKYIKNKGGKIMDEQGNVLGKHQGLHFYTIGQRKGIDLGGNGPYYVIEKRLENNELIVSNNENNLNIDKFLVEKTNWIVSNLKFPFKAKIKIRYHSNLIYGTISLSNKDKKIYQINLDKSQRAITAGQSAVFYAENNEVLGGGIIKY